MGASKVEVFVLGEPDRVVVASIDSEQSSVSVRVGDETVVLQADASRAVRALLRDLATGVPVHVVPLDAELTTQQAADLLELSSSRRATKLAALGELTEAGEELGLSY